MQERHHGPGMRMEKTPNRSEVSNAWNFDFDDDESDGADVAAFEYADSPVKGENSPFNNQAKGGNFDFNKASREPRIHDEGYSDACTSKRSTGFDDFSDEEDDIDSYELETGNRSSVPMVSSNDLSELEEHSESDNNIGPNNACRRRNSPSYNKQSKVMRKSRAFSGSDDDELDSDSDSELSPKPKWKSSHVADFRPRGRGSKGPSKDLSFGSEDEVGLYSDMDDDLDKNYGSRRGKANDFRRRRSFNSDDDPFSSDNPHSHKGKYRGKTESNRKGKDSKGRSNDNFNRDTKFRSNGTRNGRRNTFEDEDDFDGSSRGYPGRGFRGNSNRQSNNNFTRETKFRSNGTGNGRRNSFKDDDDFDGSSQWFSGRGFRANGNGQRTSDRRGGDKKDIKGPRKGGFGKHQGERRDGNDMNDKDFGEFRNSRRVIER